ncbi:cupin domain-containing protein [Blastomonas sp. AAP53]|uniref:cupin domain-containing protein n=1 Tax=Blastomonas sp. AAP53 TaxID=1248760 RepID=UPI00030E325A|nr:cupin domain-containing protein [Blastomonas sp. AAP53]
MKLTHFDPAAFLAQHWQQTPLQIRNPWDDWQCPVEPDELAGLACEPEVESRLVVQTGPEIWALKQGPFDAERFAVLEGSPWTLLVQAVDHHVPEVAALLSQFRFVPNWRIDDVMVSFASTGGGVGPHFDQYDVFLIQGRGRRRWRVGQICDEATPLRPHQELKLLADFEEKAVYDLGPGDILYVPPGVAHDGMALDDDCMTLSIGFRAPSRAELVTGWSDHVLDQLTDDDRYADPGLAAQDNPGEITAEALDRLQAMVLEALGDREQFARWFGASNSTPKYPDIDWKPEEPLALGDVRGALDEGVPVLRNPASRFSFVREGEGVVLFVDGETFECLAEVADLAADICGADEMTVEGATPAMVDLLLALANMGSIAFAGDEDDCDDEG